MSNRRTLVTAAAVVVAAATFSNDALAQQPRSDRQIPLRKGEVPAPRTDTIVVRDTLRMTMIDTVTVVRRDTVVQRVQRPRNLGPFGQFYGGLNAGAAIPSNRMSDFQSTGWTLGLIAGWDSFRAPLGLRVDGGYSRFGNEDIFDNNDDVFDDPFFDDDDFNNGLDPELWFANFDLKARVPWVSTSAWKFYAVGGASYNRFKNFLFTQDREDAFVDNGGVIVDNDGDRIIALSLDDWHSKWGGNLGAGLEFGWGNANLYLEARWQTMNIANSTQNYVPIVLGITF